MSEADKMRHALDSPLNFFDSGLVEYPFKLSENQRFILSTFYDKKNDFNELCIVGGRKGLKTGMVAGITLYEVAKLMNMQPCAQTNYGMFPQQPISITIVATDQKQAQDVTLGWIKSMVHDSWYFENYLVNETRDEIKFSKYITIKAKTCSAKSTRGYPSWMNIYDEIGWFFNTKSGNASGNEVYVANQPNLQVFHGDGKSVLLSSPAGKEGVLWDSFRYGKPIRVIQHRPEHGSHNWRACFQFATWELNPMLPFDGKEMQKEKILNPSKFEMEYGAIFADVVNPALSGKKIDACAVDRTFDLNLVDKTTQYVIALDPATNKCAYGLAMGHIDEQGKVIIDFVKEWEALDKDHPISIKEVEDATRYLCEHFKVIKIGIDQFQSASTLEILQGEGYPIELTRFDSNYNVQIYDNLIRCINSGSIEFPDDERLLNQLKFLQEKHIGRLTKYEAASGHNDDLCDVVANCAYILKQKSPRFMWMRGI